MPKIIIDVDFKDKKCEKFCFYYQAGKYPECSAFDKPVIFDVRCEDCLSAEEEYKELADI